VPQRVSRGLHFSDLQVGAECSWARGKPGTMSCCFLAGAGRILANAGRVLGTDFVDVAVLVRSNAIFIRLAIFQRHRFVADGANGTPHCGLAKNSIQR
jgi:hypothetical protein